MNRDPGLLVDIPLYARRIEACTAGLDAEAFLREAKTPAAVLRFMVIEEAARRLSCEFMEAHPEVPWPKIIGMRNLLTHEYERVDLTQVWQAIEHEVPRLTRHIETLVPPPEP